MLRSGLWPVLGLAFFSSFACADTVWLKNGDRLTGVVRVLDGKKLLLQTSYGGTIALDWKQVATLESDRELLVRLNKGGDERIQRIGSGEAGKIELDNGWSVKSVELADVTQIIKPKPLVQDLTWKGGMDFGLDYKRGERSSDDYDISLWSEGRHGDWRHQLGGEYNRELKNDVVSTDNWSADYALDRFLGQQLFWQGRFSYKSDRIEEVARQRSFGSGPGYQFWDDELGAFSMATLINRSDYRYFDGERDRFYELSVRWDYKRALLGRSVELFSAGELGRALHGSVGHSLDYTLGLRYKVNDWASLSMKASRDIVSGDKGDLHETRYIMGFGVGW